MRVGIIGSRKRDNIKDKELLRKELLSLMDQYENITICSDGCNKGADRFSKELSSEYNLEIKVYSSNWEKFKKNAIMIRNYEIARKSELLIALVNKNRDGNTEIVIKEFKKLHPNEKLILV